MPRWMRFSLVALLLALPVVWWALRANPAQPADAGTAPVSAAPSPAAPAVARAQAPAGTPEPSSEEAEAPEDSGEEDAEEEEEATGPCIAVEVTANGAPVPHAHVTAVLREDEDSYSSRDPLEVGPDGRGQSWCEPGTYLLAAHAPGFAPRVLEIVEPAVGAPPVARFRLQPGHSVSGHVLDRDSQQPIAQAQLTVTPNEDFTVAGSDSVIEDSTFTTDAQGAFHLVELATGTYQLRVEAAGHTPKKVDVRAPRPEHLSIELDGTSRLEGQVVDAAGAPVPGAALWLTPYRPQGSEKAPRTDAQGRFSLEVRDGTYSLGASAGSLRGVYEGKVTVVRGSLIDGILIRLQPAGTLSGKVFIQSSHQPVEQAFISLRHVDSGWGPSQLTDDTGTFHFENLPPGTYKLRLRKTDLPELTRDELKVESGQELALEFPVVQGATLEGRLTDGLGHPAREASVKAVPLGVPEAEKQGRWASSDEEGRYALGDLAPGRYRVEARSTSETPPVTRELAVQEGESAHADFSLPEALGEVQGVAQLAGGGVPQALVMVTASQGEGEDSETAASEAANESGHFTLKVLPGSYLLSAAYADADEPGPAQRVTVEAGKVSRVRLTVENSLVETQGVILNSRGEPAPGAQVTLLGDGVTESEEADARGHFSLKTPRSRTGSTGTLQASSEAERGELRDVRVGSTGVVLRLVKPTAARGRVVATQGPPIQGFELTVAQPTHTSLEFVRSALPFAGDTFEQVDLPAGELQFLVRTLDGRSGKAALRLAPGQTGSVEVTVGGLGRVLGRLVDPRGAPFSCWVYLDAGTPQRREDYTGRDGRFEFYALEPGPHTLGFTERANRPITLREGETLDLGDLNPEKLTSAP